LGSSELNQSKYKEEENDMMKMYEVTFMEYTDGENESTNRKDEGYNPYTTRNWRKPKDKVKSNSTPGVYLNVGTEPFIIREDDIPYYQDFGGGIRSLNFVGYYSGGVYWKNK
jgi:hypothetical protein